MLERAIRPAESSVPAKEIINVCVASGGGRSLQALAAIEDQARAVIEDDPSS
jgi:hypothetical protein